MKKKTKSDPEKLIRKLKRVTGELEKTNRLLECKLKGKSDEVQKFNLKLKKVYRRMEDELEIARKIQKGILPELPLLPGLRMAAKYIPTGRVGGDLYDIFKLKDGREIGLVIYDVSGHGVPAAVICAMAKVSFENHLETSASPVKVFEKVNREITRHVITEHYLTAFMAILDVKTGVFKYSNAGHCVPYLYRKATGKIEHLNTSGFFLGLMDDVKFEEKETVLKKGDRLLLYTDGIFEVFNRKKEIYGKERLEASFAGHISEDVEVMLDSLIADQRAFSAASKNPEDDITLLTLEKI